MLNIFLGESIKYVPKAERDKEKPTAFVIKIPTLADKLKWKGLIAEKNDWIASVLNDAVIGWENIVDEKNNAIEFKNELINKITDMNLIDELITFIFSNTFLDEDSKKK